MTAFDRANMTLSIPPDIHNLSQRRQKMTEPGPQVTRTKNLVKVGLVVQEICSHADRQTDRHAHHNSPSPQQGGGVMKIKEPFMKRTSRRDLSLFKAANDERSGMTRF